MDPDRILGRIVMHIAWMTAAGTLAGLAMGGWRDGAGFLLGAIASYFNFRWLRKLAESLDPGASDSPGRGRTAVLLGIRYILLGAGAYVILKFSTLSLTAALVGLFTAVAAVILESVWELARLWNMNRG
jgi:hypothetical protein